MSSQGFACSLEEFKADVAKFCRRAESGEFDAGALERGWRYILLRYLNMTGGDWEKAIAVTYLDYGAARHARAMAG